MRISLGIALALHAVVLAAGARWARAPGPEAPAMELTLAAPEVVMEVAPEEAPHVEVAPEVRGAPGGGSGSRSEARSVSGHRALPGGMGASATGRALGAPAGDSEERESEPVTEADEKAEGGDPESPLDGEGAAGAGNGHGNGVGDGEGDGRGKGIAKRGEVWADGWDQVVGVQGVEKAARTVNAEEATLPQSTISNVVGRNAGRFRSCYEAAWRRDATVSGLVPVHFAVDVRGAVIVAKDGGSTVGDPTLVRCVLAAFAAMVFPARVQGEAVQATYLVAFPSTAPAEPPRHPKKRDGH